MLYIYLNAECVVILGSMTLNITTLSILKLSLNYSQHNSTQQKHTSAILNAVMLSVELNCDIACHYAGRCYSECRYAECCSAENEQDRRNKKLQKCLSISLT